MEIGALLFDATLAFYCAASVLYMWSLVGKSGFINRAAPAAALVGLTAHTAGITVTGIALGRAPFTNLFGSLMFLAWAMVGIYLLMARRYRIRALGAFVTLIGACTIVFAAALPKGVNTALLPALGSHWSFVHITSSLLSYASFLLAFGAAVGYILQERMLKAKRITMLQRHLPSLDVMDHLAYKMVSVGFPMLTLGIVTGAMWAQSAWNSYWNWDPKETWALITWLVYAAYLHVRIVHGWRGKWANRLLIAGFVCMLVTFLGVNLLGRGLHRYNW